MDQIYQTSQPRCKRACLQALAGMGLQALTPHRGALEAMQQDSDFGVAKAAGEALRAIERLARGRGAAG